MGNQISNCDYANMIAKLNSGDQKQIQEAIKLLEGNPGLFIRANEDGGDIVEFSSKNKRVSDDAESFGTIKQTHGASYDLSNSDLGEILNASEGKEFINETSRNSKTALKNNGFDLSGFEEKVGENGTFFEKTHEDGSIEYLRVVSHTDENGNKSVKILNSVSIPGTNVASGRIYDGNDISSFERFSNWSQDSDNLLEEQVNSITDKFMAGEITETQYENMLEEAETRGQNIAKKQTFSLKGTGIEQFGKDFIKNMDLDGNGTVSFKEYESYQKSYWGVTELDDYTKTTAEQIFDGLDLNGDGTINAEEVSKTYSAIDVMDGNKDDNFDYKTIMEAQLSPEEVKSLANQINIIPQD